MDFMKTLNFFLAMTLGTLALTLVSCGDETGESRNVSIVLLNPTPLVSNSNYTVDRPDGTFEDIEGPWFGINYTITNNSQSSLVVQDFELEVTSRQDGVTTVTTYQPDFGLYSNDRSRITAAALSTGESFTESNDWPVESLPELNSFRYRGRITFVGYFELADDPDTADINEAGRPGARFEKTLTFTTR